MISFAVLYKTVREADWVLDSMLAGIVPFEPDRKNIFTYQAFYIWWCYAF